MIGTTTLSNGKIVKKIRRIDMRNARILIAVYECAEDARAVGVTTKEMWDTDYKRLYDNREYTQEQLDSIIHIVDVAVEMVDNVSCSMDEINEQIKVLEKKQCINVMTRIMFMDQNDIPFNVMKGKGDKSFIVSFDKKSAAQYLAFLQSLPELE